MSNEIEDDPVRVCQRLRSVIYTDDAGINHRINRFCGNLLGPKQMYCERCDAEIVSETRTAREV